MNTQFLLNTWRKAMALGQTYTHGNKVKDFEKLKIVFLKGDCILFNNKIRKTNKSYKTANAIC